MRSSSPARCSLRKQAKQRSCSSTVHLYGRTSVLKPAKQFFGLRNAMSCILLNEPRAASAVTRNVLTWLCPTYTIRNFFHQAAFDDDCDAVGVFYSKTSKFLRPCPHVRDVLRIFVLLSSHGEKISEAESQASIHRQGYLVCGLGAVK